MAQDAPERSTPRCFVQNGCDTGSFKHPADSLLPTSVVVDYCHSSELPLPMEEVEIVNLTPCDDQNAQPSRVGSRNCTYPTTAGTRKKRNAER